MSRSSLIVLALFSLAIGLNNPPAAYSQELGGVKGTFLLKGPIPQLPPKVKKGANVAGPPVPGLPIPDESIIVDPENKGLANVFVWIDDFDAEDIPKKLAKPKKKTVQVTTKNSRFAPHAIVARTGQTLVFRNLDPVDHNPHVNAIRGESLDFLLKANKGVVKHTLNEDDLLPVPVTDDNYPWMRANLLVLDHPYATISDTKGTFKIADIPPGEYDFKFWHEEEGYLRLIGINNIKIEAGKVTDLGTFLVDL